MNALVDPSSLIAANAAPCWDAIFAHVNAWRGLCLHNFTRVEMAVTESLLALAAAAPEGATVRLRHLIGQRFEDLAAAIGPDGPFADANAAQKLAIYRERHEAFRTLLCHGSFRVSVERSGQWVIVMHALSIRARQAERTITAVSQQEAEALLQRVKEDAAHVCRTLGELRKRVGTTAA